ncbi:3-phosphoshikimate 1-carboxyvinyltransferase [Methanocaldococcus infernus ME]|uniref:3-phosphoshikimate 1-carboxyvinyltransferase n=1 Tax=Methanocaldococcus infernus (strain DSM 11812 / JCM 15783 / ME) TaxID=573063 RepID=D5VR28_METIM|nr:3-phosphoshikimate 1-carboxyvinyltransferase [Methanocaldococcus infernus]ADG13031.1 3-phosphoshikimate 1-carboxyvinyltransferase [Methanocaldococcus infernus ME]
MLIVRKTEHLEGKVKAPPSKSYTHRAVISASLAEGKSLIKDPLNGRDCLASVRGCRLLGAKIKTSEKCWEVEGGKIETPEDVIDVGNSGTTLRILTSISSLIPKGYAILTGDSSIRKRPMEPLLLALRQINVKAYSSRLNGLAPIIVESSKMKGNKVEIRGDVSSQFITSLMMLLPFNEEDTNIILTSPLKSKPYLDITIDVLSHFGVRVEEVENGYLVYGNQRYRCCDYTVEGDYSSSSYIIAAGVLINSNIVIENLFRDSKQGDKRIIEILKEMGADIKVKKDRVEIEGEYNLEGVEIDVNDIPDLVPTLAVLACFAEGKTVIYNGEHVRYKECDRLRACYTELKKMGADIEERRDGLIIRGVRKLKGAELETYHDHRLVMAFTAAGLKAEGETVIRGEESVKISFPNFVEVMKSLGANIEVR